ncbi:hypothetical protein GCM10023086_52160 [Streptomyces venetus]|uniref:Uncharacterized protein n=1 Tax=Streptomyces venetus TaxID=1701086 RepID=A0ABP8GJH8_9ACTN
MDARYGARSAAVGVRPGGRTGEVYPITRLTGMNPGAQQSDGPAAPPPRSDAEALSKAMLRASPAGPTAAAPDQKGG